MNNLKFKNKRQIKDFETIYKNVFFKDCKNNFLNDIIIDISNLKDNEILQVANLYKNNKNIIVNTNNKKIAIQ
jgi:hypothetical protein